MAIHFISDLHLHDEASWLGELFTRTLAEWRGKIDALYILGDLFEYWVGDDDRQAFSDTMLAAMRDFSAVTPLFVMRGNRDFLLGPGFAAASGATLLEEPHLLKAYGRDYLLVHGDGECTDDAPYQQFRAMVRQPAWQAAFLQKSLAERHAIARQVRGMSEQKKQTQGPSEISDVTPAAIEALLARYPGATLIHGHTHRPARHEHRVNGEERERWVIADWHDGHGGYLRLDSVGLSAHPLALPHH
ncbi:UDP-2,3-diacylglucosamine diphosphatase [Vogesella oryzae]|uniref:UDP-2,3-diacylglucosamine diphosphatase n=1 Tax=Vogesella oryzae TaxID=1735285 RepID=UPI0015843B9E|nr:UDP-2,3-diacylglucosamine diphosphatase [Vogesella oryzae]